MTNQDILYKYLTLNYSNDKFIMFLINELSLEVENVHSNTIEHKELNPIISNEEANFIIEKLTAGYKERFSSYRVLGEDINENIINKHDIPELWVKELDNDSKPKGYFSDRLPDIIKESIITTPINFEQRLVEMCVEQNKQT